MIYLDNAASSFPKPKETLAYVNNFIKNIGGNPGRSGHTLSVDAARIIFEAREELVKFINAKHSERLIFTQNGTESLNLAILGLLKEKDHVIITSLEHNSVIRPLSFLQKEKKVAVTIVQCTRQGELDVSEIKKSIRDNTKAVIVNHGSNVIGTIQPLGEIKKAIKGLILIVDACQTIGSFPVDMEKDGIDILCFSCHKSLYSIQGLGAIYIKDGIELTPLKFGGTGSRSESLEQPEFLPDRYECGTPNTPAIASLLGGLAFIKKTGIEHIRRNEAALKELLIGELSTMKKILLYGNSGKNPHVPVISFNIKGMLPSEIGLALNKKQIYVRVGLHCSPLAHRTIGTFPKGTVRVSPGYFTSEKDIHKFIEVLKKIAKK